MGSLEFLTPSVNAPLTFFSKWLKIVLFWFSSTKSQFDFDKSLDFSIML
jgi:hypothetical protein